MSRRNKNKLPIAPSPQTPVVKSPVALAASTTAAMFYSAQIAAHQTSGPLPDPSVLAEYDRVKPGLAERIVVIAESEIAHRRKVEDEIIDLQRLDMQAFRRSELAGQVCGLIIGLGALASAAICGVFHSQIAASVIGAGGVTGLVTAFIIGRKTLMKQMAERMREHQEAVDKQRKAIEPALTKTEKRGQPV